MNTDKSFNLAHLAGRQHLYTNDVGIFTMSVDLAADALMPRVKQHWRYEVRSGAWYQFTGHQWQESFSILEFVRQEVLVLKHGLRNACQDLNKMSGETFVPSVIKRLAANPQLQITDADFDKNPALLNTPGGIINLLTGQVSPPEPLALCKNMTRIEPKPDRDFERCPHYLQQLRFVTGGNQSMIDYLEALAGYFLTGYVNLQGFYVFHGYGKNGKSSVAGIWKYIMGSYAEAAGDGQFGWDASSKHPEQDMRAVGKRLLVAEEVGTFDIEKIKRWTDGGEVTARYMRSNTVSFTPQSKLLFISNLKPTLNTNDLGLERRLNLIPFEYTISDAQRDNNFFSEKLQPEAPYILHRMVQSAKRFLETNKLEVAPAVKMASQEYFQGENIVGQFISECCEASPDYAIAFTEFYEQFLLWCLKTGYDAPSKKKVSQLLASAGYKRQRDMHSRMFSGLQMKLSKIADPSPTDYNQIYRQDKDLD